MGRRRPQPLPASSSAPARALLALALAAPALVLALAEPAWGEAGGLAGTHVHFAGEQSKTLASATLEECVSSASQEERAATFAGEMTALAGTARMEMRIEVLERAPEETVYHRVIAPGLGVWRASAAGVKSYRYLKQVTNLTAPARYRGAIRFRWLNAHGRLIASSELRTRACEQTPLTAPALPSGGSLD
jgi:hypothetical protein